MRNQSIAGSALPDLSEAAEQEKGEFFSPSLVYIRRRFLSAVCPGWALPGSLGKGPIICSCVFVPPCHPFPGRTVIRN